MQDKLLLYIAATALNLGQFSVDVAYFAEILKMQVADT